MQQKLHPTEELEECRWVDEEAVAVGGDVPGAELVEEGEGRVDDARVEGC